MSGDTAASGNRCPPAHISGRSACEEEEDEREVEQDKEEEEAADMEEEEEDGKELDEEVKKDLHLLQKSETCARAMSSSPPKPADR